jgi:predicted ATP-grasp superfamily ATP-dependent carboligase
VRTYPRDFGHSTAVVTTDSEDVTRQGRTVLEKLDLRGVAKVDFKRDLDGRLWLLEVNPRFNLWHHVGAAAGVNIPALVFADLMGLERLPRSRARAGVSWCNVKLDWLAARDSGVGALAWLRWLSRCKAWSGLDFRDPVPTVAKALAVVREGLQHGVVPARHR